MFAQNKTQDSILRLTKPKQITGWRKTRSNTPAYRLYSTSLMPDPHKQTSGISKPMIQIYYSDPTILTSISKWLAMKHYEASSEAKYWFQSITLNY